MQPSNFRRDITLRSPGLASVDEGLPHLPSCRELQWVMLGENNKFTQDGQVLMQGKASR